MNASTTVIKIKGWNGPTFLLLLLQGTWCLIFHLFSLFQAAIDINLKCIPAVLKFIRKRNIYCILSAEFCSGLCTTVLIDIWQWQIFFFWLSFHERNSEKIVVICIFELKIKSSIKKKVYLHNSSNIIERELSIRRLPL